MLGGVSTQHPGFAERKGINLWLCLAFLLGPAGWAGSGSALAGEPPAIGWWVVLPPGPTATGTAIDEARRTIEKLPLRLLDQNQINAILKQLDIQRGVLREARALLDQGRGLHLGLKLREASDTFGRAAEKLEEGFARYYEPGLLAEPLLQLGAALQDADQREQARKVFMRVAALVPALDLSEGYFSPRLREAFQSAKADLGPLDPGIPEPNELRRICLAAELRGMLVVSLERLGDRPLLRIGLFDQQKQTFCAVETALFEEKSASSTAREMAERIKKSVAAVAGVVLVPTPVNVGGSPGITGPGTGPGTRTPPPPVDPWYLRHWWIWPVAAGIIAAGVTLPLTVFRKDVVDVRIRY